MIEVLSGSQLVFRPFSDTDQRLKADLRLRNPHGDRSMVFKIKSTDISAFQAEPSKGLIRPKQQLTIPVFTTKSVDPEYARLLATKNKFLVEYVLVSGRPTSVDQVLHQLKTPSCQNVKIYINTNSVRGGSMLKSSKQPSISGTNRYSFHSMAPNLVLNSDRMLQQGQPNQLNRLKQGISQLEQKRKRLLKQAQFQRKHQSSGVLKYIIVLIIGIIVGNIGSHYFGVSDGFKHKIRGIFHHDEQVQAHKEEEEGFFSIFNFGNDEQQDTAKKQEDKQKSWFNFL